MNFSKIALITLASLALVQSSFGETQLKYSAVIADLYEKSGFPYIVQELNQISEKPREKIAAEVKQDRLEQQKNPQAHKPIFANIIESPLSHLLSWMLTSSDKGVQSLGVYDRNGMLIAYAQRAKGNQGNNVSESSQPLPLLMPESWLPDTTKENVKPYLPYKHSSRNGVTIVSFVILNQEKQKIGYFVATLAD